MSRRRFDGVALGTGSVHLLVSIAVFCGCTESSESIPESTRSDPGTGTSGGGERRIESPEAFVLLSRNESLGLAVNGVEAPIQYGWCKAIDPNARVEISRILRMDENRDMDVRECQCSAMYCLGYVGKNEDALAVEHFLLTGHKYAGWPFGTSRFRAAFTGIALMARRNVPEAKRIMAQVVRAEYWKEIAVPVRYFDGLDPLEEDLVLAVYAAGIADGGPNPELIKETIESSTHKNLMSKFLAPERVDQQRQEMLESEQYPVSDSARVLLQGSFRHHYTPLVREYGDEVDTEGI